MKILSILVEVRRLSCSLAFNGNSVFCLSGLFPFGKSTPASARSRSNSNGVLIPKPDKIKRTITYVIVLFMVDIRSQYQNLLLKKYLWN